MLPTYKFIYALLLYAANVISKSNVKASTRYIT